GRAGGPSQTRGWRPSIRTTCSRACGGSRAGGRSDAAAGERARMAEHRSDAAPGISVSTASVVLDGGPLTLDAVAVVARRRASVVLAPDAARRLDRARQFVDRLAAGSEPIYGITTGVGEL